MALNEYCICAGTYDAHTFGWTWNTESTRLVQRFCVNDHTHPISSIAATSRYICSGSVDESIRVYNAQKLKEVGSLHDNGSTITSLCFVGNSLLLAACADGAITVYTTKDFVCQRKLNGHAPFGVISMKSCPQDNRFLLLTLGKDSKLKMWNVKSGKTILQFKMDKFDQGLDCFWSLDSTAALVAKNTTLHLYNIKRERKAPPEAGVDGQAESQADGPAAEGVPALRKKQKALKKKKLPAQSGEEGAEAEGEVQEGQAVGVKSPVDASIPVTERITAISQLSQSLFAVAVQSFAIKIVDVAQRCVLATSAKGHQARIRGLSALEWDKEGGAPQYALFSVCSGGKACVWKVTAPEGQAKGSIECEVSAQHNRDLRFTCLTAYVRQDDVKKAPTQKRIRPVVAAEPEEEEVAPPPRKKSVRFAES